MHSHGFRSKAGRSCQGAGVGVQTLHYYERLGLLQKPKRSAQIIGSTRPKRSGASDLLRKAQALGLTLEETKQSWI